MLVVLAFVLAASVAAFAGVLLLGRSDRPAPPPESDLIDGLDALLPQTQCGQCTFTGCRPYATAMARGEADTNQCPPGGDQTAARLARLLGRDVKPVSTRFGDPEAPAAVAFIVEEHCIGCARCIPACPVDAIIGAARQTHTVIAVDCTGCKLCIAPCPVDCIELRPRHSASTYPPLAALTT
jgi:Na+-translocating ferredoxin:NAD+ oxidoreductase subunit B